MSGVEIVGLALAVFPLVIEGVERYHGVITGRDIKYLTESLKNNEQIFKNSVENLLRSSVESDELTVLLDNLQGTQWKDPKLERQVVDHLGQEAESILKKIKEIHDTVFKLQKRLPERKDDASVAQRAGHVMRCFVRGPSYKISLERVKTCVGEFRTLTEDALKLAPLRRGLEPSTRDIRLVKECAAGLHKALEEKYNCDCHDLHPTNMQLDLWSLHTDPKSDVIRLHFPFLFAHDAQNAEDDRWVTAEVTTSRLGFQAHRLAGNGPHSGSLATTLQQSSAVLPNNTTNMTGIVPQTTSPTTQSVSQASQTSPPDAINDLCMFFKPSPPRRPRSGSISSASGLSVQLSPQANRVSTLTSVKLTEVFAQRKTLTNRERVELALTLALAVLQISCTNWMKGKWTSDHLLLVTDASRKMHPYIVHRFQSSRRGSIESTLAPPTVNQVADWIKNISLFALGVFLLEVCFNQSIEDLATPKEKQSNGDPWPYTPLLTAKRLSKAVQDHLGLHYAQAVSACLDAPDIDMDQAGEPKNSTQFEKSIQKNIVGPLKALSEMFS